MKLPLTNDKKLRKFVSISLKSFVISNLLFILGIFIVDPDEESHYTEGSLMVEGIIVVYLARIVGLIMLLMLFLGLSYFVISTFKGSKKTDGDMISLLLLFAFPILTTTAANTLYTIRV